MITFKEFILSPASNNLGIKCHTCVNGKKVSDTKVNESLQIKGI